MKTRIMPRILLNKGYKLQNKVSISSSANCGPTLFERLFWFWSYVRICVCILGLEMCPPMNTDVAA